VVEELERLRFVALPFAYAPTRFFINLPRIIRLLRREISEADYLHFAIGGLWGDWASVASLLASHSRLPFAIWTDRVESQVTKFNSRSKVGLRRRYTSLTASLMARYERFVVRRCALGLFHGMDCYRAYAKYCTNSHVVHDVHVGANSAITTSVLANRLSRSKDRPLRLAYAGRVHTDKGVHDWIEALALASEKGMPFTATWFGAGPELTAAQEHVIARGASDKIEFPGALNDHSKLLLELKQFDAFVFCHKTPESPRCLIEALLCGLPIIGYETEYPRDLIRAHGGGCLTRRDDVQALATSLIQISKDRNLLADLSERAARDGAPLTDEGTFRHRSELMKTIRVQ
jgi:glycosyltransferase involved in cell wall biosynthesis